MTLLELIVGLTVAGLALLIGFGVLRSRQDSGDRLVAFYDDIVSDDQIRSAPCRGLPRPRTPSTPLPLGTPLRRIYEVSALRCPGCEAEMRILAFITDPAPIVAILRHLDLSTHPPALSPAGGPPQPDLPLDGEPPLDLDQTPAFDPVEPDATAEFDFDQDRGGAA